MSFPSTLDTFPVVLPTDLQDDAGKELDVLFNRATAGLVAVETRLGITGSTDPTSVEARLSAKAPLASPTFSGTVSGITAAMVGAEPAGVSAADITDSTAAGRALLTAADAAAQRTALGVGTGGAVASTDITDSTAAGRAILTAADAPAQRTALGLGSAATSASSAFAAAAHGHASADITDSTAAGRALLTAADAAAQRTALGVGTGGAVASTDITDSTAAGRAILTAADAPAQRTALGLGSAATSASSAFAAAAHGHASADITDSTAAGRALLTAADAAAQRTALGVGTGGAVASTDITDSTAAGRAILTAADASAQRTALGLGTAATSASSAFAAASHAHSTAEITSLSTYLTDFLKSAGVPVPIVSIGIPFAIFPGNGSSVGLQFTGSAGAFTLSASLLPNLWNLLAAGFWMYLPANFGGQTIAAGWYWATMSSTTAGIVYTNTYSSGLPVAVDSPTAFGANLTGWLTQTTAEITGPTGFTLPGGSLGPNGFLDWWFRTSGGNSGTVKTLRGKAGTATIGAVAYSASPNGEYQGRLYNQGKTNRQGAMRNGTSTSGVGTAGTSMTTTEYSAIDTTSNQTLSITLQTAGSSEGIVLLGASFESSYRA